MKKAAVAEQILKLFSTFFYPFTFGIEKKTPDLLGPLTPGIHGVRLLKGKGSAGLTRTKRVQSNLMIPFYSTRRSASRSDTDHSPL